MIKINEYPYSKEQLEIIMNRKGETLIAIDNKLIKHLLCLEITRQNITI